MITFNLFRGLDTIQYRCADPDALILTAVGPVRAVDITTNDFVKIDHVLWTIDTIEVE